MRFWVIVAIIIFAVVLVFTIYNVAFQTSAATENTTAFPNPIYKSMNIDTSSKYGLVAFSAVALCFFIWGFPRKK
jgi:Mn2+/Fe2+ NRAMP family transporter